MRAAEVDSLRLAPSNESVWQEQLKDRFLLHERIGDLHTPTLALWGGDDRLFDVSGIEVLCSLVKSLHAQVLPGIGPLPMMEAPKETSLAYSDFLKRLTVHP